MALVCRGLRGATTARDNTKEAIIEATRELLERMIEANAIKADDVAAAFFTTTEAAYGVAFFGPLKPQLPADAQATKLPFGSVSEMMVLLKLACT